MRFIEEFIAVSIALVGRAIIWLIMSTCVVSLFAAGISLLARVIYWLRFGDWITSVCHGHVRLLAHISPTGNDQAFLCMDTYFGWIGIDKIITWLLSNGDMSLSLLLIGLFLILVFFFVVKALAFIPEEVENYYKSMKYFQLR